MDGVSKASSLTIFWSVAVTFPLTGILTLTAYIGVSPPSEASPVKVSGYEVSVLVIQSIFIVCLSLYCAVVVCTSRPISKRVEIDSFIGSLLFTAL